MMALSQMAAAALAEFPGDPEEPSGGRWELGRRGAPIVAVLDSPWLILTAPVADVATPRELLAQNAALPSFVKFAFTAADEPQLRAELPLDEDAGSLIREVRGSFASVLAALGGEQDLPFATESAPAVSQDEIKRVCEEAGWTSAPRGDAACVVELECPDTFLQATLAAHRGGLRACVELAKCDEAVVDSVSALVLLMLRAGGAVRLARPILPIHEGRVIPAFEVTFSSVPTAALLAEALAALSVAGRLCAEEARALHDPDVAREFLALNQQTTRKE